MRFKIAPELILSVTPDGTTIFAVIVCVPDNIAIKLPLVIPLRALLIVSQSRPAGSPAPTGTIRRINLIIFIWTTVIFYRYFCRRMLYNRITVPL